MTKTRDEVKTNGRAVFYTVLWESFRKAALDCGWTLALHGSMASDMDIMGMPWVEDAESIETLVSKLNDCIDNTIWKDYNFKPYYGKPHKRIVYNLSIFGDFYIDLSVMPYEKKTEPVFIPPDICKVCGRNKNTPMPDDGHPYFCH